MKKDGDDGFHDGSFMTNTKASNKEIILQAAKDTGFDIEVRNIATDSSGKVLDNYIEVHTKEHKDHSEFWDRFDELQKKGDDGSIFKKMLKRLMGKCQDNCQR